MDFELIDDMRDYERAEVREAQELRLALISAELRRLLAERQLYRVVDNAPAAERIAKEKAMQELRTCNGCDVEIGRALGADVVVVSWVQKVSNLILNVNIEVKDTRTGNSLYSKSVDLRGNTDASWLRGVRALVASVEEKQQHLR